MEWSWTAWWISVAAVVVSGMAAWFECSWIRRPGLDMGFVNHGGMWGDLLLLPMANAVIVPDLTLGAWIVLAFVTSTIASVWVHIHWYRGRDVAHSPEHMWPCRPHGSCFRDLSWAGWLHVLYVIGELTLLIGFLMHPAPPMTVLIVAAIFTIHVPIGLLQPRWFVTRQIGSLKRQPLLLPCLAALWIVAAVKM